ncbi:MAG: 30S ribosome-binding factor RbfA [Propionibacteriaceae bacterium]|nr:30S ribosome-binding factor RbfA [Propionibacteriaceae bacterium]
MGNPRNLKVAEQIRFVVAEMLERRIKDPRLGFVTLTDVRVTGDNREATIFYTVLGDEASRTETAAALASATGLLRSSVGKQLGMKFTPTLAFVLDGVEEDAAHLEDVLARARALDAEVAARAANASYAGDADPYKRPEPDDVE